MSAPKKQELYIEGINMRRKIPYVKDINELIAIRDQNLNWYAEVQELVKDTQFVARFARIDNAVTDYIHNGGAGVDVRWDQRSKDVIELLRTSTDEILDLLETVKILGKANYIHEDKALFFGETMMVITDRAESREAELLNVVFSDKLKRWAHDEIIDKLKSGILRPSDEDKKDYPKNVFYHAGKSINKKVSEDIQLDDFLIVTTKDVQINPKYL